jgi:hypothetical protein
VPIPRPAAAPRAGVSPELVDKAFGCTRTPMKTGLGGTISGGLEPIPIA